MTTVREAKIILPLSDNDGKPLDPVHARMADSILRAFGGFTQSEAMGAWKDPETDKLYTELVIVYQIAMEDDQVNRLQLSGIAAIAAREAKQECVYVVHSNGHVEFVRPLTDNAGETLPIIPAPIEPVGAMQ